MANLRTLLEQVAARITPREKERKSVEKLSKTVHESLVEAVSHYSLDAEVRLDGSVAKDTWLSGQADLDIFLRITPKLSDEDFRRIPLKAAHRALRGYPVVERFADHPYLEGIVDGVTVNVVPCYRVEPGQWVSATDRTPFHTEYVNSRLTEAARKDVRLLKAFMNGIGAYGADIKTGGFSGMLCETITIFYKSFESVMQSAAEWKPHELIDVEGYYASRQDEVTDLFREPLIVIDPIDAGRNVAAAVRANRLWEFVAAARRFNERPSRRFFFPPKLTAVSIKSAIKYLASRSFIGLQFGKVEAVVDVLWSQLYRSERAIRNALTQAGFSVVSSSSWSDEKRLNLLLFELENLQLAPVSKHLGPEVSRRKESVNFLARHVKALDTAAGPWVDGSRWAVAKYRKITKADMLLRKILSRDGGKSVGIADRIAKSIRGRRRIVGSKQLADLYRRSPEFRLFFSRFIRGWPNWLE